MKKIFLSTDYADFLGKGSNLCLTHLGVYGDAHGYAVTVGGALRAVQGLRFRV
jgi:hypothetical protein